MTSGEHQMERMGQPEPGHFEIRETPAAQPFHARAVGANGEVVWWCEDLVDRSAAEDAVKFLARVFGIQEPSIVRSQATGHAVVLGGRRAADLVYVDDRDNPAYKRRRYALEDPEVGS